MSQVCTCVAILNKACLLQRQVDLIQTDTRSTNLNNGRVICIFLLGEDCYDNDDQEDEDDDIDELSGIN